MRQKRSVILSVAFLVFINVAGAASMDEASRSYKANADFASLKVLSGYLHVGMKYSHVVQLFGPENHSPTFGIYYWTSDREEIDHESGRRVMVGLTVTFSTIGKDRDPDVVKSWAIGPLIE
jgi:hypothetical protein